MQTSVTSNYGFDEEILKITDNENSLVMKSSSEYPLNKTINKEDILGLVNYLI